MTTTVPVAGLEAQPQPTQRLRGTLVEAYDRTESAEYLITLGRKP